MHKNAGARAIAKAEGRLRYFTGVPCCRGHVAERQVVNGKCFACKTEDYQQDYTSNTEKWNLRSQAWKDRNREYTRQYARDRQNKLGIDVAKVLREWRKANPEKARAHDRNSHARRKGAEGKHTNGDIERIFRLQKGKCAYCRCQLRSGSYEIDHIHPVSKGGSNFARNIQILCCKCNQKKRDKLPEEFSRSIGMLI